MVADRAGGVVRLLVFESGADDLDDESALLTCMPTQVMGDAYLRALEAYPQLTEGQALMEWDEEDVGDLAVDALGKMYLGELVTEYLGEYDNATGEGGYYVEFRTRLGRVFGSGVAWSFALAQALAAYAELAKRSKVDIIPIPREAAFQFVKAIHRHLKAPPGDKFRLGAFATVNDMTAMVGVVIVGRPEARHLDEGNELEVTRLAVIDGGANLCSALYAAAWKETRALGYDRLITFTRIDENGGSLRAAGFELVKERTAGGSHDRPSRARKRDPKNECPKQRWEKTSVPKAKRGEPMTTAAPRKAVDLIRVSDGQVVSMPARAWATSAYKGGHTTAGIHTQRLHNTFMRDAKQDPARKNKDRPQYAEGYESEWDILRVSSYPAGNEIFVRTGGWAKGDDPALQVAAGERFLVRGVRAGADTKNWLNRPELQVLPKTEAADTAEPFRETTDVFQTFRHVRTYPGAPAKFRDVVTVVVGIPRYGSEQTTIELPGDIICVPVFLSVMLAMGFPARVQPLDTPGNVRVYTDQFATLGNVWQVGAVGLDDSRGDRMGSIKSPGNAGPPKQGIAAYVPAFDNDPDLYGPVVILMPGVKRLTFIDPAKMPVEKYETYEHVEYSLSPVVY